MNESIGVADEKLANASEKMAAYAMGLPSGFQQELAATCTEALQIIRTGSDLIPMLPYFKERYASNFRGHIDLVTGTQIDASALFGIAFYIYAIFQEQFLRSDAITDGQQKIHAFFDEHFLDFPPRERMRIKYLRDKLPFDALLLAANGLFAQLAEKFKTQQAAITEPVARIVGWDQRLSEWDNRVQQIEGSLKGHTEKLNFVGLSRAFSQQASEKVSEKYIQAAFLVLSGVLLVVLPFFPLVFGSHFGLSVAWNSESLPKLIPFAVAELVILYIFRVFLRNYMSAKTQLVQLELRKSLCAFVQSYAEFVAPLRKQGDPKVLEKFEALIFSGISPDPQNVPSQFDGLEAVVQAVKDIKN